MFLTFLYSLFSSISSLFSAALKILQANPRLAIALVLVAASAFGVYKFNNYLNDLHHQISDAQHKEKIAEDKADQLQKDLNESVKLNHDNQTIIGQMQDDKKLDDERVKALSEAVQDRSKKYNSLLGSIQNSKKEDDGPVAKVLADTIKAIQLQRGAK